MGRSSSTRVAASPYRPPTVPSSDDLHVLSRFGFGYGPDVAADLRAAGGGRAWFAAQLTRTSDASVDRITKEQWWPGLLRSPQGQWQDHVSGKRYFWQTGTDMAALSLMRKVVARWQVREAVADFWLTLLHVPIGEARSAPWRMDYEDALRRVALTDLPTILRTAITHPSMSGYLTNHNNTRVRPNENLGRELLELHTVGREAGYTEDDVKASSRLLTGFWVDVNRTYDAAYRPAEHWTGAVKVLGFSHANASSDGRDAVAAYLTYLALHPSTAQRIARRLCVRFVSDTPSSSVVAAVREAYTRSGGDVRTCLRALVAHPDFWTSKGTKVMTPVDDVVAAFRAVRAMPRKPTSSASSAMANQLLWMTSNVGGKPYTWPRPDGAPLTGDAWSGASRWLNTWNARNNVAGLGAGVDVTRRARASYLPTTWPRTTGDVTDHVSRVAFGRAATSAEKTAVATMLGRSTSQTFTSSSKVSDWTIQLVLSTLMCSPRNLVR